VLRPGGKIHVADWGRPDTTALRAGFLLTQFLDGFETTTDHVRALWPDIRSRGRIPVRYRDSALRHRLWQPSVDSRSARLGFHSVTTMEPFLVRLRKSEETAPGETRSRSREVPNSLQRLFL
jgi:hypothetical protein